MRRHLICHHAKFPTATTMSVAIRTLMIALLAVGGMAMPYAVEPQASVPPAAATRATAATPSGERKAQPAEDLREVLARTVQERNRLVAERDGLISRLWFLAAYALAITLAAGWLVRRLLTGSTATADAGTDTFAAGPATAALVTRKNATITIRNSETQQAEVTSAVTTRRFFAKTEAPGEGQPAGARGERRPITARVTADPLAPHPASHPEKPITARIERRPITVRVEQQVSDRLPAVEVELKPGTGKLARRDAFTLVEVMISIAMLATILAAVISGSYTLRQSQQATTEQTQVRELTDLVAERIMGANWDWIGRDRPDEETETRIVNGVATLVTITNDYRRGAWSWHRRRKPLSATALPPLSEDPAVAAEHHLQKVGLIRQPTGIRNLKLYVEYYTSDLLTQVFTASGVNGPFDEWEKQSSAATGADLSYILSEDPETFDLSKERRALVVRLLVTWTSSAGGERQHQLVFARRK